MPLQLLNPITSMLIYLSHACLKLYRTTINDIQAKATNMQRAGTQQGGAVGYQDADMKNNINTIVHDTKTLLNKPQVN